MIHSDRITRDPNLSGGEAVFKGSVLLCAPCLQVWLRDHSDTNGHPIERLPQYPFESITYGHLGKYHGFSFSPGTTMMMTRTMVKMATTNLRRKSRRSSESLTTRSPAPTRLRRPFGNRAMRRMRPVSLARACKNNYFTCPSGC